MTAAQLAHLRLMSTLPVRTIPARVQKQPEPAVLRPGCAGQAVIVNGKRYETLREASKALNTSRYMLKIWINEGKARYAESATGEEE